MTTPTQNHKISEVHEQIEQLRDTSCEEVKRITESEKVITLASSHLDMSLLTELYQHLLELGNIKRLTIVVYARSGDVNAARRIALLLRQFCQHLTVVAPFYCQSSATLLALAADRIYFTPISVFSTFDPHLCVGHPESPNRLSSADIKLFQKMAQDWFNTKVAEQSNMLAMLCEHIFPPKLTAFYRTVAEVKEIAREHLALSGAVPETHINDIIDNLMFGDYSHDYALTGEQLAQHGLPCIMVTSIADTCATMAQVFERHIRDQASQEESWCDCILASDARISVRWKDTLGLNPIWSIEF